jgi:acid phosphatase class B
MKVSFDFDGCLGDNKFVQMICKMFISSGHEVFILTSRNPKEKNIDLHTLAKELNINSENVIMTNGELKVHTFLREGFDLHFDNSFDEVVAINNMFKETSNPLVKNESQPAILVNFDSDEVGYLVNYTQNGFRF